MSILRVHNPPPEKPLLIYDGECSFCRRWIIRWKQKGEDRFDTKPYQELEDEFPEIDRHLFQTSIQLILPNGDVYAGSAAAFRALSHKPAYKFLLFCYHYLPGFAWLSDCFYKWVAAHRSGLSRWMNLLWGKSDEVPSYLLTRWVYGRFIGIIFLIAFVSLGFQIIGLIGQNGILPAKDYFEHIKSQTGFEGFWILPSLCWFYCSDGFLEFLCWGGAILSLLLVFNLAPALILLLIWIFYLSLVSAGQVFLHYQWDTLMLEMALLSLFYVSWQWRPKLATLPRPSPMIHWLLKWLLFRLMFSSGVVKLISGDPTWRNLTALQYHYETQPLPTWIAWYLHHLPDWFHTLSAFIMFIIELVVPFLIFMPRRCRLIGCYILIAFQIIIFLSGNQSFLNFLALALCIILMDDQHLRNIFPQSIHQKMQSIGTRVKEYQIKSYLIVIYTALVLIVSGTYLIRMFTPSIVPSAALRVVEASRPYSSVNPYGLFAVMTVERPEIIVEGSRDGEKWVEYRFRWKPGDLHTAPPFVAPHQPRLDWQMWFAALEPYRRQAWFTQFMRCLLEGKPEVLMLLKENPFPVSPPKYVRAVLYQYRFTDPITGVKTGQWWQREMLGLYSPVMSLKEAIGKDESI